MPGPASTCEDAVDARRVAELPLEAKVFEI
jgi:hypothetical protein